MAHAERVADLVRELGGTPPQARPAEDYARLFPRMNDEADALHFARDLEERLVRAYLEGLRLLPDSRPAPRRPPRSPPTRPRTWPWCTRWPAARRRRSRSSRGRCERRAAARCCSARPPRRSRSARPGRAPPTPPTPTSSSACSASSAGSRPPTRARSRATRSSRRSAGCCSATSASTCAGWSRRSAGARPRATAPAPKAGLDFASRRAFARSALELERETVDTYQDVLHQLPQRPPAAAARLDHGLRRAARGRAAPGARRGSALAQLALTGTVTERCG